ncbi:MAG: peptidylprolyl isomerase [Sphingobacteriales bacterium 50-39]|nr:peptidylprolyl isomerase [Sphingobacteriales bacterium]OJW54809.1 MAG: peptidylprolyl isomerase [Sphingobacteriales bacterium 50-39]
MRFGISLLVLAVITIYSCNPRLAGGLRKHDLHKDVEMITTRGTIILRLSDSTPLHSGNFRTLVKKGYYDSILFHRVIRRFMIQAGDPNSKHATAGASLGDGGPAYTVPAEFRTFLFHKRGALAAAREGDDVNPQKASSGSQFYIVQGKVFSPAGLDSIEQFRLKGRKIPEDQRAVYQSLGGAPHLDQGYTVFGEVIRGMDVVDSIAAAPTSGRPNDRPLQEIRILKMRLINR